VLYIFPLALALALIAFFVSYFVTELLGTDLHRLLTSRPLEKQFIQYFLYQILVSPPISPTFAPFLSLPFSVGSNMCTRLASSIAIL
jgi:ABC-type multidrug transport system permease subunit